MVPWRTFSINSHYSTNNITGRSNEEIKYIINIRKRFPRKLSQYDTMKSKTSAQLEVQTYDIATENKIINKEKRNTSHYKHISKRSEPNIQNIISHIKRTQ